MPVRVVASISRVALSFKIEMLRRYLAAGSLVALVSLATLQATPLQIQDESKEPASPSHHSIQGITVDELFSKLSENNQMRESLLHQYSAIRTYEVRNDKGKVHAKTVVVVQYQAPGSKTFSTTSEEGSKIIRRLVFKGLMESESEAAAGRSHHDSAVGPENYTFNLLGQEDADGYHCYVVEAVPKRKDKYLFEGKVWIDAKDFAIVKIAGRPAKNPSFWITRVDFVRRYQKVGEFWLPLQDESITHVRLYGKKILTIDHHDYTVNVGTSGG